MYCAKCICNYNDRANIYGYCLYANLFSNTFFTHIQREIIWESSKKLIKK